jgi:hypothetical protein
MDRLLSELERLYLPRGTDSRVRAAVLQLLQPSAWDDVARVWQGVQADLGLPAPAIAVSGSDAYQLWFSLAEGVAPERAQTFLAELRARYLAGVPPERVRLQPPDAMPPAQVAAERWSAFVAPDLAPLFVDEPWLDHPPGPDAQADLLSRVVSIAPPDFERALRALTASAAPAVQQQTAAAAGDDASDPRGFLLSVMRDPGVDLRLRIEAAKALLSATRDA